MIAPDSARCRGTRRDGAPCRATVILPSGYCPAHDPSQPGQLRVIGAKGGRAKSKAARADRLVPASLRPVLDRLLDAMEQTHAGSLDPRTATALASLAGAIVKTYQVGTLEERLQALEQAQQEAL